MVSFAITAMAASTAFGQTIYFSAGDRIFRLDVDAEEPEQIIPNAGMTGPAGQISSIVLDLKRDKILWVDTRGGAIRRANLNGTGDEDFVRIDEEMRFICTLTVDRAHDNLYWHSQRDNTVWRAKLDDPKKERVTRLPGQVNDIFFDQQGGYLYWSDISSVRRARPPDWEPETLVYRRRACTGPLVDLTTRCAYWISRKNYWPTVLEGRRIPDTSEDWQQNDFREVATTDSMWVSAMAVDEASQIAYLIGQPSTLKRQTVVGGPCLQKVSLHGGAVDTMLCVSFLPSVTHWLSGMRNLSVRVQFESIPDIDIDPRIRHEKSWAMRNAPTAVISAALGTLCILLWRRFRRRHIRKAESLAEILMRRRRRLVTARQFLILCMATVFVAWAISTRLKLGYHGKLGRVQSVAGVIQFHLPQTPWPIGGSEYLFDLTRSNPLPKRAILKTDKTAWDAFVKAPSTGKALSMLGLTRLPIADLIPVGEGKYYYHELQLTVPYWQLVVGLMILWLLVRLRGGRLLLPHECAVCRYDLTGNTSGVCPECGAAAASGAAIKSA